MGRDGFNPEVANLLRRFPLHKLLIPWGAVRLTRVKPFAREVFAKGFWRTTPIMLRKVDGYGRFESDHFKEWRDGEAMLVSEDGDRLLEIRLGHDAWGDLAEQPGETVLQAMKRLGKSEAVRYLVHQEWGVRISEGEGEIERRCQEYNTVTVYVPAEDQRPDDIFREIQAASRRVTEEFEALSPEDVQ